MAVFQQQRVSEWFPPLNKKKEKKWEKKSCHLEAKISGKCLNILILVSQNVNLLTQTSEKIRQITFEILTWNFNLALPNRKKVFFFHIFQSSHWVSKRKRNISNTKMLMQRKSILRQQMQMLVCATEKHAGMSSLLWGHAGAWGIQLMPDLWNLWFYKHRSKYANLRHQENKQKAQELKCSLQSQQTMIARALVQNVAALKQVLL